MVYLLLPAVSPVGHRGHRLEATYVLFAPPHRLKDLERVAVFLVFHTTKVEPATAITNLEPPSLERVRTANPSLAFISATLVTARTQEPLVPV